jgi:hypothetical protein
MKATVESDELLASYIARLEDLEKDRSVGCNNNETNSSAPKANPHGSYPSFAPLPVNNANYAYGMTPNPASGQYPQFQPHRPNMVKTKLSVDIGNTNLYQNPYDPDFDRFPLPRGWHMP